MMRICLLSLALAVALAHAAAWGQGSTYRFSQTEHHFGTVKEEGGDLRHRFVVYNTGTLPLKLLAANASCGCTSPDYSKAPIAPQDSGYVDVVYHPAGRPGAFKKDVTVQTDGQPSATRLFISGQVTPKPLSPEDQYPDTLGGGLRIISRYLNLGDVSPLGGKAEASFEVVNMGSQTVGLALAEPTGPWMKVKLPGPLPPMGRGMLTIRYNGKARKDWGYATDPIRFRTTGIAPERRSEAFVTVNLQTPAQALTPEQAAKAPRLALERTELDFGRCFTGQVYTRKFVLRNTGARPLALYAAKPGCRCLRLEFTSQKIAPGGTAELYVHFDANGYLGPTAKAISLFSADPANPVVSLSVKGDFTPAPGKRAAAVE